MTEFSAARRANRLKAAKLRSPDLSDVREVLEKIRDASARALTIALRSDKQKAHPHTQKAVTTSSTDLARVAAIAARKASMRAKKLANSGVKAMLVAHPHATPKITPVDLHPGHDKRSVQIGHRLSAEATRQVKREIVAPIRRDKIEESAKRIVGAKNFERIKNSPKKIAMVIADRQMERSLAATRREIRTESMTKFNETQLDYIERANDEDDGWGKRWDAKMDHTCRECAALNGEIREVGEVFSNGLQAPPVHPNCQCSLTPVRLKKLKTIINQTEEQHGESEEE